MVLVRLGSRAEALGDGGATLGEHAQNRGHGRHTNLGA
jgi:hypothetical protein